MTQLSPVTFQPKQKNKKGRSEKDAEKASEKDYRAANTWELVRNADNSNSSQDLLNQNHFSKILEWWVCTIKLLIPILFIPTLTAWLRNMFSSKFSLNGFLKESNPIPRLGQINLLYMLSDYSVLLPTEYTTLNEELFSTGFPHKATRSLRTRTRSTLLILIAPEPRTRSETKEALSKYLINEWPYCV